VALSINSDMKKFFTVFCLAFVSLSSFGQSAINLASKEPAITSGTSVQYWNGSKSFVNFGNSVRNSYIAQSLPLSNSRVLATDSLSVAFGKVQAQLDAKQEGRYALPAGALLLSYGDSYTVGNLASTTPKRYTSTINEALLTVESNQGVSGKGVFNTTGTVFSTQVASGNANPTTIMIGFNDMRVGGSVTKNFEKIKGGHLAMIANHFLRTAVPANSGSVTTGGTWTTLTAGTYNDKASISLSGLARTSSVSGSTLTYTSTGENLVIGTWGTDGTADGAFSVSVDGTVLATFDPDNKAKSVSIDAGTPTRSNNAVVLFGLGGSTHTVVITTLSSTPTNIDYIGTLQAPNYSATMLVGGLVKMDATGYAQALSAYGNTVGDADWDLADTYIKQAVAVFQSQGYPVVFVYTNKYYVTSTDVSSTDHIHPNDIGHGHIARAFLDVTQVAPYSHFLGLKSNASTTDVGFRVLSDAGYNLQGFVYGSGKATAGIVGANVAYLGTSATTLYIGSQTASSTVNFLAGGLTTADVKAVLSANGNYSQSSASAGATLSNVVQNTSTSASSGAGYFAISAAPSGSSTLRAQNDAGLVADVVAYGSTVTQVGVIGPSDGVFSTTLTRAHFGSKHASGTVDFFVGGTATGNIRGLISNTGLWNIGDNSVGTSTLTIKGSFAPFSRSISALRTLDATDQTIFANGTFTVTLPTAVGITDREYLIKNTGAGTITLATTSSQTIDGSTTYVMSVQYKYVRVKSDGANWNVIANN
jgi:hypothetical protein